MQLHQDWSFVDHTLNPAVNIWCPLVDVDETNGSLKIVPGSHTCWGHIGLSTPHPPPIAPVMEILEAEFTIPVTIPAGWAVFYDPRLLHGSDENRSTEERVATVCCTIPADLSPRLYYAAEPAPTTLEIFEVSPEFLSRCTPAQRPDGVKQIGVLDYPATPLEPSDLDALRRLQHELAGTSPAPLDPQMCPPE